MLEIMTTIPEALSVMGAVSDIKRRTLEKGIKGAECFPKGVLVTASERCYLYSLPAMHSAVEYLVKHSEVTQYVADHYRTMTGENART